MKLTKSSREQVGLSFDLKLSREEVLRISQGRLFQSEGAETTNARDPMEDLDLGTSRNISLRDLRSRDGQ